MDFILFKIYKNRNQNKYIIKSKNWPRILVESLGIMQRKFKRNRSLSCLYSYTKHNIIVHKTRACNTCIVIVKRGITVVYYTHYVCSNIIPRVLDSCSRVGVQCVLLHFVINGPGFLNIIKTRMVFNRKNR